MVRPMTARLPALDGLRAVAALLVVATHAAYLSGFTVNGGLLGRLAGRGDFGVAIFFALSGFLLHFRLVSDARDGQTDVKAYAVRRAARVLPAYWVTLAVVVAVAQPPVRTAVAQALTVQTYLPGTDLDAFSQSWSIPTELSFYLVLPLVVWLLERARRRDPDLPVLLLVGSAVLTTVALAFVTVGRVGEDVLIERWLPARWPSFAVGMVLAELLLRPESRWSRGARRLARDSAGLPRAGRCRPSPGDDTDRGPADPRAGVRGAALGPAGAVDRGRGLLLAPLVLGRDDAYSAALASRPARNVGTVSYGLFLWHLPVFAGLYALTGAGCSPVASCPCSPSACRSACSWRG